MRELPLGNIHARRTKPISQSVKMPGNKTPKVTPRRLPTRGKIAVSESREAIAPTFQMRIESDAQTHNANS